MKTKGRAEKVGAFIGLILIVIGLPLAIWVGYHALAIVVFEFVELSVAIARRHEDRLDGYSWLARFLYDGGGYFVLGASFAWVLSNVRKTWLETKAGDNEQN